MLTTTVEACHQGDLLSEPSNLQERLAGLAPEEQLSGLTIKERLAGLSAQELESLSKRLQSEPRNGESAPDDA